MLLPSGERYFTDSNHDFRKWVRNPGAFSALQTEKHGCIVVNEEQKTSIEGIYAGGDIATGAATVILAMGAGKKAASSILNYLKTH